MDSTGGPNGRAPATHGPRRPAPTGGPGRPRSERARSAVLAAVTALLPEVGYQSLTMEAVAARAGVGKTTVYRWWPTKAALVIDAIADTLPTVEVAISGETRRDVRAVVARLAHTDTAATMADALPALAAEARRDPDAAQRLAALLGPRRAADAAVLLAAAARRDLPHDVDVPLLLDVALGTLLLRRMRGEEPTDDVVDALTDLLIPPT
ncbi:TetR/AcrR family transcriptional regulator [Pseudonocardia humida]|uniref:TetR/AcrR family transcriptional regulator n=1 Tax=Pseudonocardia humida TaxID=2800819 RepID=A0ABT1AB63_9PSEU|nr:TetR/AcrR family transcriptional regulator [Pseudonocardia humida]MCO1660264.1 TetR/AcrR family transcriptional regulator [Pseudonocardia humida]